MLSATILALHALTLKELRSHSFVDEAKRTDHAQTQRRATPPPSSQAMSSSSMYTSQLSEPDSMLNDSTNLEDRIPMSVNNKHQCWDHGCNGREFSSKSNLTRHKKEREGKVAKVVCPFCGAIFSRSSARDTHLTNQSCDRIRRYSNGRPRPSRTALMDSLIQDRNTHDERFGTSLQYS